MRHSLLRQKRAPPSTWRGGGVGGKSIEAPRGNSRRPPERLALGGIPPPRGTSSTPQVDRGAGPQAPPLPQLAGGDGGVPVLPAVDCWWAAAAGAAPAAAAPRRAATRLRRRQRRRPARRTAGAASLPPLLPPAPPPCWQGFRRPLSSCAPARAGVVGWAPGAAVVSCRQPPACSTSRHPLAPPPIAGLRVVNYSAAGHHRGGRRLQQQQPPPALPRRSGTSAEHPDDAAATGERSGGSAAVVAAATAAAAEGTKDEEQQKVVGRRAW